MWYAKTIGAYSRTSKEAISNANEIYDILSNLGWTLNAVCGLLGNLGAESGYNPWRWQNDSVQKSTGSPWTDIGYGLVQFTPASKYINNAKDYDGYSPNFSDKSGNVSDGYSQINYVNEKADYYSTDSYPLSYTQYKISEEAPSYLAKAWLYNYERPKHPEQTEQSRGENADYWYQVLSGEEPPQPTPTMKRKGIPVWMMIKRV